MKNFWTFIEKYFGFIIAIIFLLVLFILSIIEGMNILAIMYLLLLIVYCFWFVTQIEADSTAELLKYYIDYIERLDSTHKKLIAEYKDLIKRYNELKDRINDNAFERDLIDD